MQTAARPPALGRRLAASIARLLSSPPAPPRANTAPGAMSAPEGATRTSSGAPSKKSSATGPLIAFENLRRPVWTPRDYQAFAREGFMQNAIVYRCVRMIAECAGSVPLLLYAGEEEIADHPLLDLVRRPNPGQVGPDLIEALVGNLLVSGNAYVEAVTIDGDVREIYALRPDRMKVVPGSDGWPQAFDYTVGGRTVRLPGDSTGGIRPVLHLKFFHPADDHYGLSPLEPAATAIDLHNTAAQWNKALLDNSARPSGALVYTARDGNLSAEQYERLKSELEAGFQGSANAGRPLLLEGGLDWKSMSLSPKDMDFIEARHVAAREIALALGVPPMLLGIPGDNTYSNLAEAQRIFWRQTVLPLVNRTATALTNWLGPTYAPDAQWASEGASKSAPLRFAPDLDAVEALSPEREALWARLEKTSFLTDDEKRTAIGYGPKPTADRKKFLSPDRTPKFNPNHDALGRFTTGDGEGEGEDGEVENDTENSDGNDSQQYSVDLAEEGSRGGHAQRHHVGKSDEYLISVVANARVRGTFVTIARISEGSFLSIESANDLTNQILKENQTDVDLVAQGVKKDLWIEKRFGYVTGKEAYRPNAEADPYIRPTYNAGVYIKHDPRSERGYRVHTAYPLNDYPKGN